MKKAFALLMTAAMTFTLVACGNSSSTATDSNDSVTEESTTNETTENVSSATGSSVVNVGLNCDIATLAPFGGDTVGSLYILPEIYQYLFALDAVGGEYKPMIGKSYEIADDNLSFTVTLFDYVTDSAGNAITADDVVFSYEIAQESTLFNNLANMESVEKIDDYTVKFNLIEAKQYSPEIIMSSILIVDKDTYNGDTFATAPVGSGPYVVTNYVSGSELTLTKNPNYWQTDDTLNHPMDVANVDTINYKIITENAQMSIALENGDIDLANNIDPNDLTYFADENNQALEGYTISAIQSPLFTDIFFNCATDSNSNVLDLNLRKAIMYALDTTAIAQGVLKGHGEALNTWGCAAYSDYNTKWDTEDYYDYNLEMAQECLEASDYVANGSPAIRIIFEANDERQKAAEMMQSYLLQIGVNVEILSCDAALYSTSRNDFNQWDIELDNQANPYIITLWYTFGSYTKTEWNGEQLSAFGTHDETLEALLNTAMEIDGGTPENMDTIHQYLKDNGYVYGIWARYSYAVSQNGITDIALDGKGYLKPGACTFSDTYESTTGM